MKVIIKYKNLDASDALASFVEKKFYSLKKFINILKRENEMGKTLAEVFVELEKETKHHRKGEIFRVKSRVVLPGKNLTAWFRSDDIFKAIVGAKEELKAEIEKHKLKKIDINRRLQRKINEQQAF